jgi:hypothetical protein
MAGSFTVGAARPEEVTAALHFIFRHLDDADQEVRIANVRQMIQAGELDPAGILVARGTRELVGALICLPVAGASGLIWPPQTVGGGRRRDIEDRLVQYASAWLRRRGAKLAQTLLIPEEADLAVPLRGKGDATLFGGSRVLLSHSAPEPPEEPSRGVPDGEPPA